MTPTQPRRSPMLYALLAVVSGVVALGLGYYTLRRRQAENSDDTQIPRLMIGAGALLAVAAVLLAIVALTR